MRTPASSKASRRTASSRLSAWSMNPASVEYMLFLWRTRVCPSSICRPSGLTMAMIATGFVRGYVDFPHAFFVHRRSVPPFIGAVGAPQKPQNDALSCHVARVYAWHARAALSGSSAMSTGRASSACAPSRHTSSVDSDAARRLTKSGARLAASTPRRNVAAASKRPTAGCAHRSCFLCPNGSSGSLFCGGATNLPRCSTYAWAASDFSCDAIHSGSRRSASQRSKLRQSERLKKLRCAQTDSRRDVRI
mmetsp:Transcript_5752/g.18079  ORF Transcript_5752/g.18079 Transcript_5752/m.18079 type:complete len:249 (-) Transcript_5752:44-790(-)